jgi:hypothetical protein
VAAAKASGGEARLDERKAKKAVQKWAATSGDTTQEEGHCTTCAVPERKSAEPATDMEKEVFEPFSETFGPESGCGGKPEGRQAVARGAATPLLAAPSAAPALLIPIFPRTEVGCHHAVYVG